MASPTQWTRVWVNFRSWWWTGRPGLLHSMGSQRVGHDWATELNCKCYIMPAISLYAICIFKRKERRLGGRERWGKMRGKREIFVLLAFYHWVKTISKLNRDPLFKGRYIFLNDSNWNSISKWNHESRRKVKYTGKVCRGITAVHIFTHTQFHTTWENRF